MPAVADWVTINDFSAGIYQDDHQILSAESTALPRNGAATVTGTFRCHADKAGALIPLPTGEDVTREVPFMDFSGVAAGYHGGTPKAMLLDALVMGPVVEFQTDPPGVTDNNAVYTLWAVIYDPAGVGTAANLRQYIVGKAHGPTGWFASADFDYVFTKGDSAPNILISWPSGSLDRSRAVAAGDAFEPGNYRPTVLGSTSFDQAPASSVAAMSAAEQTLTDFDTVTYTNGLAPSANLWPEGVWNTPWGNHFSPRYSVGKVASPDSALLKTNAQLICGHQGRAVYTHRNPTPFYGNSAGWFLSDFLAYSKAGDFTVGDTGVATTPGEAIFAEESPSPVGVMCSMSANDLLLVKHQGGGVLVRGDIANPQVVRLPLIHSTGGYTMRAAHTPFGVFYGCREGVARWDGGDSTEIVSRQISSTPPGSIAKPFWVPQAITELMEGNRARFGYWDPWVLVPNGWLLDTQGGGRWRLEDPDDIDWAFSHYDVSYDGTMWAFNHQVRGAGQQPMYRTYKRQNAASSWSWKSQPLVETREREDNFAELELVAQKSYDALTPATATIDVTLTGYTSEGDEVTATNTITLHDNGNPQLHVQAINPNFVARFVQIRLEADSGDSSLPAPKVMSVRLGRAPRARTART